MDGLDASLKNPDPIALVSPESFRMLTGENVLLSDSLSRGQVVVSIHRLRPPLAPSSKKRSAEPSRTVAPLQTRMMHKIAGKSVGLNELPSGSIDVAELHWSRDVPDCHIALSHRENVEDYDLVWLVVMPFLLVDLSFTSLAYKHCDMKNRRHIYVV